MHRGIERSVADPSMVGEGLADHLRTRINLLRLDGAEDFAGHRELGRARLFLEALTDAVVRSMVQVSQVCALSPRAPTASLQRALMF